MCLFSCGVVSFCVVIQNVSNCNYLCPKYTLLHKEWISPITLKGIASITGSIYAYSIPWNHSYHYDDVIMGAIASLITSLTIVYSTVYSDADQRTHQSSASLAFVCGIHRGSVNSPHKWPLTRKMMTSSCLVSFSSMVNIYPPWWRHQMEIFWRYWPFVRVIHPLPVNSPHKGQWREALKFSLIDA